MLRVRHRPTRQALLRDRRSVIMLVALFLSACGGATTSAIRSPSTSSVPTASTTAPGTPAATTPHGTFTLAAPYLAAHQNPRTALLPDGRVLVLDGPTDPLYGPVSNAVELYDPKTNTFSLTGTQVAGGIAEVLTPLNDGRVLVTGASSSPAQIYDPATGQFTLTGRMVDANRADKGQTFVTPYTATTLKDGRVLIVGGVHAIDSSDPDVYLRSAELYDPATGKFSPTGSLTTAREDHTATLLSDGRVLIVGGDQGTGLPQIKYIGTAEIYDPTTGVFSPAGNMTTPRSWHTATLLPDGRVLIAGGLNVESSGLASAEIYEPSTGKFTVAGSLRGGRNGHVASLLKNGSVLIAAGFGGDNPLPLNSAEIYQPVAGTFSATAPLLTRYPGYTSATGLQDGRVMVVGDSMGDAELYWP